MSQHTYAKKGSRWGLVTGRIDGGSGTATRNRSSRGRWSSEASAGGADVQRRQASKQAQSKPATTNYIQLHPTSKTNMRFVLRYVHTQYIRTVFLFARECKRERERPQPAVVVHTRRAYYCNFKSNASMRTYIRCSPILIPVSNSGVPVEDSQSLRLQKKYLDVARKTILAEQKCYSSMILSSST